MTGRGRQQRNRFQTDGMKKRSTFGSRFGAIAVVGGSVVGLGNIWRFPYIAGENGGAAFILVYILMSLLISIPVMLSEFTLGRRSRSNALGTFRRLAPHSAWQGIGYMGIIAAVLILSFYAVIAGWALEFLKEALLGHFSGRSAEQIAARFETFVASGWRPVAWTLLFLIINASVLTYGVVKGIERYNKFLMPLMVVLLVGLALNSATLSGFREGAGFLLRPDFGKITPAVMVQALGQSFFSMSLGMGTMITYGSYIRGSDNFYRIAGSVAGADVCIALLSGLAIFPAVFSFGISPTSGPDLVFITLPALFAQMPGGYFVAVAFFFLLLAGALTSSFSLMEVIVAYLHEEFDLSRRRAVSISFLGVGFLAALCALSQVPGSRLRVGGWNFFDLFNNITSDFLLPIGGLAVVVFTGWFLDRRILRDELTGCERYGRKIYPVVRFLIKFIIPFIIALMFLNLKGFIR